MVALKGNQVKSKKKLACMIQKEGVAQMGISIHKRNLAARPCRRDSEMLSLYIYIYKLSQRFQVGLFEARETSRYSLPGKDHLKRIAQPSKLKALNMSGSLHRI